jgi:hypothetical protein
MKQKLNNLKQKSNIQKHKNGIFNVVKCSLRSDMGLNHPKRCMSHN